MLAIRKSSRYRGDCSPNVLPCKINHNGPVNASKRYWNPIKDKDEKTTAYFRGRKLHARTLKVPKGLKGYVLLNTDKILPAPQAERKDEPEEEEEDEDEKEEEVKIVEEVASFQEVMVWGHEAVVDAGEDCYVRGVEEWIRFAESIHSYEDASTQDTSSK